MKFPIGLYFNKVSSETFQKDYYERAVKAFESRKEQKLQKIKEEKERKELEGLVLKPQLNENKNKKIKMTHEQRLMKFMSKKEKEIQKLKKELEEKRKEEETREATFQPQLVAKKKNQKLVENLASKGMAQMTVCNQNLINLIDGRNKKTHVCELKAKKEEPLAFKPKILKKSEVLRVN